MSEQPGVFLSWLGVVLLPITGGYRLVVEPVLDERATTIMYEQLGLTVAFLVLALLFFSRRDLIFKS